MSIKTYFSDQTGAPTLNGTVGSLVAVLDACLVDGFNPLSVASITRTGSTVLVETVTDHGYANPGVNYWAVNGVGNYARISGADQAAYNGDWPVTYVTSKIFSFDIGAATPTTPATGTIVTRRAPAGFAKAFSDTNKAVYRSNDTGGRRFYLQVIDNADNSAGRGARMARWRGFEKMTGVDSGTGPFPTILSAATGQQIRKSSAVDTTSRRWTLISDGRAFLFQSHPDQSGGSGVGISGFSGMCWFGDYLSMAPDAYAVLIDGDVEGSSELSNTTCGLLLPSNNTNPNPSVGTGWSCIARRWNGQQSPVWPAGKLGHGMPNSCFGLNSYTPYPDPFANRIYASQVKLFDAGTMRGLLPLYELTAGIVHSDREVVSNVAAREGRKFMYLRGTPFHQSYHGGVLIDLTGEENGTWS